jgi:transposase
MPRGQKYPIELIDRGVRLAIESGRPVAHVAKDIGLPSETLRKAVRQAEADGGLRPDLPTSEEREEIKRLKRENSELRRARARRRPSEVTAFIDMYRDRFGVEPICRVLDVSASAYYHRAKGEPSARAIEDQRLLAAIRDTHHKNYEADRPQTTYDPCGVVSDLRYADQAD